jgi:hypothetical protein
MVATPLTLLFGPVVSLNVLAILAPATAGWSAYLLAEHITGDWLASLIGGYLFGFSSYEVCHALGNTLNLVLVFLIPLIVLLCVRHIDGTIARKPFIAWLTLAFIAQCGISTEILATMGLCGAVAWATFTLCAASEKRHLFRLLAIDIAISGALFCVFASPFLFYLIQGYSSIPHIKSANTPFSTDPMNFIIPSAAAHFGRNLFAPLYEHFSGGGASEQTAYLGVPTILIMLFYFRDKLQSRQIRALMIATVLIALLSLGSVLHVGDEWTAYALPWALIAKLPVIQGALPAQITMYVALCASLTVALYLSAAAGTRSKLARYGLAGLAALILIPNFPMYAWKSWPSDPFFAAGHIRGRPNLLILPLGPYGDSMAWQAESHMAFTQSSGYVGSEPSDESSDWPLYLLTVASGNAAIAPDFGANLVLFCSSHRISYIVMSNQAPPQLVSAVEARGWPQRIEGDVTIVTPR